MDMWTKHDENDTEATEEEEDDIATDSEVIDETDILSDFMKLEAERMKELAAKPEEKKEQLQHLIGVQKKRDNNTSEETLITLEDEVSMSNQISSESSIHPCLREIDISDSQLKIINPYTVYRIPDDPGLLPAFWLLRERPPIYSTDGVQKFYDAVKHSGLRPVGSLKNMLVTDQVNLRYYGLDPKVMKAICESLTNNTSVRKVDFKDNKLSTVACKYLNDLLLKNNVITSLSLSDCQIGASGAKKLCKAISANTSLKTLDLSNCNIGNEGLEYIILALSNNQGLENINLSNNHLEESCSENLQDLLLDSEILTHLDLSWNSLHSAKIWKALIDGLSKNETLRSLNLSWNALEKDCVPYLYRLLLRSQSIEKLDLSWNRFTENDAVLIARALLKNNTLQELHLGNNPLKARGALDLVRAITPQLSPHSVLCFLDLENVWANKDILQELETIKTLKPWVTVKLRGILSNFQLIGPNARRILLKRANYEAMQPKKKRQRRNFGHFVMSLTDKMIPRARFMALVKKFKLKLSTSLINEIMNVFTGPKDTVDQGLLKSFYLEEYPETTTPPSKLQKKGKATRKTKRT